MTKKRIVVIGFFGTQLDSGKHEALVNQVKQDIAPVSPETNVVPHQLPVTDPWDFEDVYGSLFDFAKNYPFDTDKEEYWAHIATGSHVVQICMFLMAEAHYFPGQLLQSSPPRRQTAGNPGSYALIDLDLSRYDQIGQRFSREQEEGVTFLKSGIATRNANSSRCRMRGANCLPHREASKPSPTMPTGSKNI